MANLLSIVRRLQDTINTLILKSHEQTTKEIRTREQQITDTTKKETNAYNFRANLALGQGIVNLANIAPLFLSSFINITPEKLQNIQKLFETGTSSMEQGVKWLDISKQGTINLYQSQNQTNRSRLDVERQKLGNLKSETDQTNQVVQQALQSLAKIFGG